MKKFLDLCIGAIRDTSLFRGNNAHRGRADAEYKAVRPRVMEEQQYRCRFCGYTSRQFNHCHHLDGNHANNVPQNMVVADTLCHAYHHLGQQASQDQFAADNLGRKTVLAAIPELSPTDVNLLQRAIGVALHDPQEEEVARAMHKLLTDRAEVVREAFGTFHTGDFAAAMKELNDAEYENRVHVVGGLRLVFRENVLKNEGGRFLTDFPSLPFKSWESVKNAHDKTAA